MLAQCGSKRQECRNGEGTVLKHHFENHDLATERCSQLIDLTDEVTRAVERAGVENGMALVYSPHTTCAVLINELEPGIDGDFSDALEQFAPSAGSYYRHDDPALRNGRGDDTAHAPNGHAHVRAGLLASSSQTISIVDRTLQLGRYQRIFFCELDGARERKVFIQVMGE